MNFQLSKGFLKCLFFVQAIFFIFKAKIGFFGLLAKKGPKCFLKWKIWTFIRPSGCQYIEINVFYTFTNLKLSKLHILTKQKRPKSQRFICLRFPELQKQAKCHCDTLVVCQQSPHSRELAIDVSYLQLTRLIVVEAQKIKLFTLIYYKTFLRHEKRPSVHF